MAKDKKKKKKLKKISHQINLRIATKTDFLELEKYTQKKGKRIKKWKMITGFPYWLYNSKGKIENKNYILNENTDLSSFSDYLLRNQVLILTSKFD